MGNSHSVSFSNCPRSHAMFRKSVLPGKFCVRSSFKHFIRSVMEGREVYAISDLHVDYKQNLDFVESWSDVSYQDDVLIVAGDVTDKMLLLEKTLTSLKKKFKEVFYVPGNHELWIRDKDDQTARDSISKFHAILSLCDRLCVHHRPRLVGGEPGVWVVPLYSWYAKPEDDPADSLYIAPSAGFSEDVEFGEQVWMDNHFCDWSRLPDGQTPARYFASLNSFEPQSLPVVSFSHFVPRCDLIRADVVDTAAVTTERTRLGLGPPPEFQGANKSGGFNFTRYAGARRIEAEVRRIASSVHVYGHQHRNRDREIDGVRYVSHCLGNPREQKEGWVWGLTQWGGPKKIWTIGDSDSGS